jgi:8-oxo-dGTP diphosphatase
MIRCEFEHGSQASLRHGVIDAIVTRGQKILLVKRAAKLHEGGKWALPGGYVERGETVWQAAAREVLEETGWTIKNLKLLAINTAPDQPGDDRQNLDFIFSASAGAKTGTPDWESDEVQWFDLQELPANSQIAFDHAKSIALFRRARSDPASSIIVY